MAPVEIADAPRVEATADDLDGLPALAAALVSHANKTQRLIARMEYSVEQGDRMLAELGLR